MASAIAAALAAGGALTDISKQSDAVQAVGFAAFVAWLVTAGLLLWAAVGEYRSKAGGAAAGVEERGGGSVVVGNRNFIQYMYAEVEAERNAVYSRLAFALAVAALAIILTATAVGVRLFDDQSDSRPSKRGVTVTAAGRDASPCSKRTRGNPLAKYERGSCQPQP